MEQNKEDRSARKLAQLRELMRARRSLLIVMQDNPDPDAIGAAAGLRRVVRGFADINCSLAHGGVIGRSENRALADYLGLRFRPVAEVDPASFDAVAMVDTQPGTGNNSLPENVRPHIILDHHPRRDGSRGVPFSDIRSNYGAVSTMVFEYLKLAGIVPEPPLATALLYGIRTDTKDLGPGAGRADVSAVQELYPLANTRMLSAIQRGSLEERYFRKMAAGLLSARIYGPCVIADLGELSNPDMVGEMADLLLRLRDVEWALCYGVRRDTLWASLRTSRSDGDAAGLVQGVVAGLGTGGGHARMAGAQVPVEGKTVAERRRMLRKIRDRFLRKAGGKGHAARRLVRLTDLRTHRA